MEINNMKNEYILSVGILVVFDILVLKFIGTAGIDIINSVLLLIVPLPVIKSGTLPVFAKALSSISGREL